MKLLKVIKSPAKDNKYKFYAIFYDENNKTKTVKFGTKTGFTFVDGAPENVKTAYRARHKADVKDNNNPMSPGNLSWFITWGDSQDVDENIEAYRKKFNV